MLLGSISWCRGASLTKSMTSASQCIWKVVLDETDALCKKIRDRRVTVEELKRRRNILRNFREHSRASVAFSMFFLNRTNRSGIVHGGGMIGGYKQTGKWKLDARYNKPDLIRRIEAIAAYSNRI